MLSRRATQIVSVMRGERPAEEVFNAHFLAAVPPAQLAALAQKLQAENGKVLSADGVTAESASAATFRIRFARATATGYLALEPAAPFKVAGFRITSVVPTSDTPDKLTADFAALPGRSGFSVSRLGDAGPSPIVASHADKQFAIGSAFKLWVLDALAEDIAAGRHHWDDVVRLGPRSLPGGMTQDWPPDAPVTVETLATLMISISDNTATDTLIRLIGRESIAERVKALGHGDPSRMLPFLTTAEAFALKLGPAERRDTYVRADDAAQARMLDALDASSLLAKADPAALAGAPSAIERIEWFASPDDVLRVLDSLRRREDPRVLQILGVAPNLDKANRAALAFAGYKGGSESGVLNLTWLLRARSGEWYAVTASWNDPEHELDNARLEALVPRLLALVPPLSRAGD